MEISLIWIMLILILFLVVYLKEIIVKRLKILLGPFEFIPYLFLGIVLGLLSPIEFVIRIINYIYSVWCGEVVTLIYPRYIGDFIDDRKGQKGVGLWVGWSIGYGLWIWELTMMFTGYYLSVKG